MTTCVPVRDMKDTARFTELVRAEQDVTVTKNGYDEMHCLSTAAYDALREEAAKAKLLSRMMLAEDEIEQDSYENFAGFLESVRRDYDL